jgi:hypothetical protein
MNAKEREGKIEREWGRERERERKREKKKRELRIRARDFFNSKA